MSDISEYGKCMDDHAKLIAARTNQKPVVIFSAYNTNKSGLPINNLNMVAIEGKVILVAGADDFWGDNESVDYQSEVLTNPSWLDVSVCADKMIHTVRDLHHVFLENIYDSGKKIDGVPVYHFSMGS